MKEVTSKKEVQKWLLSSVSDPIVKILLKKSNLTKIQLETILIDILAENMSSKPLNYYEKAKLRLSKGGVSRGAFNRTLRQAKNNIISSLYTVLLLGYLGFFGSSSLDGYIEVSNKLQSYINAYRDVLNGKEAKKEELRIISLLHEELKASLELLSKPNSF
jgi:hypothetical protein